MSDLAAGMAGLYKLKPNEEPAAQYAPDSMASQYIAAGKTAQPSPQIAGNEQAAAAAIEAANPKTTVITQPEGGGVSNLESQKKDITKDRPELYAKNVEYARNVPDAFVIAAKEKPAGTTDGTEPAAVTSGGVPKAEVQQAVQQEATKAKKEGRGFDWGALAKLGIGLADIVEAWAKGQTGDQRKLGWEERRDIAGAKAGEEAERAFMEKMAAINAKHQMDLQNARSVQEQAAAQQLYAHQRALAQQELAGKGGAPIGNTPSSYYGAGTTTTGGAPYVDPAKIVSQYQATQAKTAPKTQEDADMVAAQREGMDLASYKKMKYGG